MKNKLHYLREWRKFRCLTQGELAAKVGTSISVISDLERDVLQLSPKWLQRIAPILGTSAGDILDHDPSDINTDILRLWSNIPDENKDIARRILEQFSHDGYSPNE